MNSLCLVPIIGCSAHTFRDENIMMGSTTLNTQSKATIKIVNTFKAIHRGSLKQDNNTNETKTSSSMKEGKFGENPQLDEVPPDKSTYMMHDKQAIFNANVDKCH